MIEFSGRHAAATCDRANRYDSGDQKAVPASRDRRPAAPALLCLAALGALAGTPQADAQAKLNQYRSKYYVIHSDLDADTLREADLRITRMAECYRDRTRGFAGELREKMPFYLFSKAQDYYAAGGLARSAGVFDGKRLMAIARPNAPEETWHVVQHEGFHQFLFATVGGEIPIWINEGLAEYFGTAVFTGDGFYTGLVPTYRLRRVQALLRSDTVKSLRAMMQLPHEAWNLEMNLANYDQAWSMIHFIAHADGGKYQKAFNGFMQALSRGGGWEQAWEANFGRGVRAFEEKWQAYWAQLQPDVTRELYTRAGVATLTGYFARAVSQNQRFVSAEEFFEAARAGRLRAHEQDWLPRSLLERELAAQRSGSWSLDRRGKGLSLVYTDEEGTEFIGSFEVSGNRVKDVDVDVVSLRP